MKVTRVGSSFIDASPLNEKVLRARGQHTVQKYALDRKPIITPPILPPSNSQRNEKKEEGVELGGEQYLLIPNKDHIQVLSMEHGQTICKLVPHDVESVKENQAKIGAYEKNQSLGNRIIQTVTVVRQLRTEGDVETVEWVVMAGFDLGVFQEWRLSVIVRSSGRSNCSEMSFFPNRVFKLPLENKKKTMIVTHITSPISGRKECNNDLHEPYGTLYTLIKSYNIKDNDDRETIFMKIRFPFLHEEENRQMQVNKIAVFNNISSNSTEVVQQDSNGSGGLDVGISPPVMEDNGDRAEIDQNDDVNNDENPQVEKVSDPNGGLPFALLSVCCESGGSMVRYVAIVSSTILTIYYEKSSSSELDQLRKRSRLVHFKKLYFRKISAAAMAPNGKDISLGYDDGKIDIFTSILPQTSSYIDNVLKDVKHPREDLLRRTFHWHAHSVKTLCYLGQPGSLAAPNLLSGGEEAVLVTWNTERGSIRPAYTLPRLSQGCITHLATNMLSNSNSMEIVLRSMDNTLQLIEEHNHSIRWKIQGLACLSAECVDPVTIIQDGTKPEKPSVILQIDPKTHMPILTRMEGAPGFIHWYDLNSNQVVGELEVAPYNRTSRKVSNHMACPRPTVTNFVMNSSGTDFITVDTMLTENTTLGKGMKVRSFLEDNSKVDNFDGLARKMSLVTNIKFWTWSTGLETKKSSNPNGKQMPYELISAMPNPHGRTFGGIDGLAISQQGSRACSISHEEGSFHIWAKGKTLNSNKSSLTPVLPLWKRLCKITIPSDYANLPKSESGRDKNSNIAFSSDGSVLAIAFGKDVTLWDHTSATLLNTIRAPDYLCNIKFVLNDILLAVGKSCVSTLAPFNGGYLGKSCWSYKLPYNTKIDDKKIRLGLVTPLKSKKDLAVAIKQIGKKGSKNVTTTKILLIDMLTGDAKNCENNWFIPGNVQCLCDISQSQSSWSSDDAVLLALTDTNEMFVLDASKDPVKKFTGESSLSNITNLKATALSSSGIPKIEISKKRKSSTLELNATHARLEDSAIGKGSLVFDSSESTSLSTSQLPALTGAFTQSFIARTFKKIRTDSEY